MMERRRPQCYIVVGVASIWIVCSSITQIANKKVLSDGSSPWTLVSLQMIFGTIVYYVNVLRHKHILRHKSDVKRDVSRHVTLNIISSPDSFEAKTWLFLVGVCNAFAHLLTLYAIQMITPALTQIIRGTEPIWLMLFSFLMLKKRSSYHETVSAIMMASGLAAIANSRSNKKYTTNGLFVEGILFTLAANSAISIRNCSTKKYTLLTSRDIHYPEVCAYSLVWVLYPTLVRYLFTIRDTLDANFILWLKTYVFEMLWTSMSVYVAVASIFHVVYSTMSFYVLSFMEPTSHSIVKLISRTIAVLSLTLVYGIEEPSVVMVLGIILCVAGAFIYSSSFTSKRYLKSLKIILLLFFCLLICLYALIYKGRRGASEERMMELRRDALSEVGLKTSLTNTNFTYPMIPISGYRNCLNQSDVLRVTRNHPMAYLGVKEGLCKGCVLLDIRHSFDNLSNIVCHSKALYCGRGSSLLCGLLAMSTKTIAYVDPRELDTWPHYMRDFVYGSTTISEIEYNHRLLFDRHTIKQSNRLLTERFKASRHVRKGFDLFIYTRLAECNETTTKHIPLPDGNMGDIFGSHLSDYFSRETGLNYSVLCYYDDYSDQSRYDVTVTFVGSIAEKALIRNDTVLLGVGTIKEGALSDISLRNDTYVLGVRGPRTRDAFISKYGINPDIVGDPGLYVEKVFEKDIKKARKVRPKRDLCFISHEEETEDFYVLLKEYRNRTISANGDIRTLISYIATCNAVVSSSLHGVVFAHALSIPALPVKASNKLAGGAWKFIDYYYGINVTQFTGRFLLTRSKLRRPRSVLHWLHLVAKFPQPSFPINVEGLTTLKLLKSLFKDLG